MDKLVQPIMVSTSIAHIYGILYTPFTKARLRVSSIYLRASLFIFLLVCTTSQWASAQQEAYIESGGLVVIQAESVAPVGDWVIESSEAGHTGSGYIRWNGPNLYGTPGVGTLAYTVYISDPGDYNVRLRMSHAGAPAGDQWNDCWARMDNGTWAKALHPADKMQSGFTFDSILEPEFGVFENMRYTLSAGLHTLYISGRSENLRVDRIHFYKDNVGNPLSLSLPESPLQMVDDDEGNDDDNEDDTPTDEDENEDDSEDNEPANVEITGELKKWHPVTLTLDGPWASEEGSQNPFLDYRFQITFSQNDLEYTVPGYFAADGNAAETSSNQGTTWRVHFVPPTIGQWDYVISMRTGNNVSVDPSPLAGTPSSEDGTMGSFTIDESDKSGRDHRSKGILRYNGEHYLQFDNGDYFLQGGASSPENFLAFEGFDGTYNHAGSNYIKQYENHIGDWRQGDPTWRNGRGQGIIGAINYLSDAGMNALQFITMNVNGEGNDVWPWTSPSNYARFDVSKLAQWDRVFSHMDKQGILIHLVLQEAGNERLLNNGTLDRERKLYYRELIARFGYHHALIWNLGEEAADNTGTERQAFASYIRSLDPYNHPVVVHASPGQQHAPLPSLMDVEGVSLKVDEIADIHSETLHWRTLSAENNTPWVVHLDAAGLNLNDTGTEPHQAIWAHLMAGGAGIAWDLGQETENGHLSAEDWRSRSELWQHTHNALSFFQTHLPFSSMIPLDELTPDETDFVLAAGDSVYAIYVTEGDSVQANLPPGSYTLAWYNPQTGGDLQAEQEITVEEVLPTSIGLPSGANGDDWVALLILDQSLEEPHPMEVDHFVLVDADSDTEIGTLRNGDVLDLGALPPHLNIVAETRTDPGQRIAYVYLELTPTQSRRRESIAPYALFGDLSGNYLNGTFDQGELTLTATPYGFNGNPNEAGKALTISFTVTGYNPATQASKHVGDSEENPSIEVSTEDFQETARSFSLEANYPNPFNPVTTIPFSLDQSSSVRLVVYDLQGREIQVLIDRTVAAGQHNVTFDAAGLPSGTYLYRLDTEGQQIVRQMVLLK